MITGPYNTQNNKPILESLGILFDGDYRENLQPEGVYNYVEKFVRTLGLLHLDYIVTIIVEPASLF